MNEITTTSSSSAPIPATYLKSPLPDLVYSIQMEFNRAEKAANTALDHAVRCGQMLRAAKERIPHGSWMKWVENNTTLPHSTVTTFMHLAANSQRVGNLGTIRGALKLLADGRKKEPTRQLSESYVPFDGEPTTAVLPVPVPVPVPAPRQRATNYAEIVEQPATPTAPPQIELETTAEIEAEEPPLVVDETKTAKPAAATTAVGMAQANAAIWRLDEIKNDDPEIRAALDHIMNYCRTRQNELATGRALR
jgi:hypothetical protein